jgi:hypothetical protein
MTMRVGRGRAQAGLAGERSSGTASHPGFSSYNVVMESAARLVGHYAASVSGGGRAVDRFSIRSCRRRSLGVMPCQVRKPLGLEESRGIPS